MTAGEEERERAGGTEGKAERVPEGEKPPGKEPRASFPGRDDHSAGGIPRSPWVRNARLASLPLGFAGRSALRLGRRLLGQPVDLITGELQRRTSLHLFRVLGELKGGAMKFGQMLSVFEAALPPEVIGPYRAALTLLQEAAPALPAPQVHAVLAGELGPKWREHFREFSDTPAAAASIGQVHRAVWADGRQVAVKIQYPGAAEALLGDYAQLGRLIRLFSVVTPGLDVEPMLRELRERVADELDYRLEGAAQQAFADAYRGDAEILVPDVALCTERVLVTQWLDGTPLSAVIREGTQAERDHAGLRYARFLFSGPARAGRLHADPHPGNFRVLEDGRLGVIDFGAVKDLPDGLPSALGTLLRLAQEGDWAAAEEVLVHEGIVTPGVPLDPAALGSFLLPLATPAAGETYRFTREWLREEVVQAIDLRESGLLRRFNLPPSYVLVNRVVGAATAVLCQLECTVPFRAEVARWLPGFAEGAVAGEPTAR
ncbi:ABC transporter ATP-binding protein [Streptomyces lucensis JCM 4490]|uniref:ABC transporter ATP-binding protein n=1 Tax=Streptomyces lucensis JCM 4490 TaxID=1306176 RepID=A0A918JGV6_9ACTN|nr:AarF/ABC1/UbiB kinase family protein [Streptomyces lucensis]GGW80416.1 ABC transporter ATP-binding protein [Streptomyces lucensis JCM 4490]